MLPGIVPRRREPYEVVAGRQHLLVAELVDGAGRKIGAGRCCLTTTRDPALETTVEQPDVEEAHRVEHPDKPRGIDPTRSVIGDHRRVRHDPRVGDDPRSRLRASQHSVDRIVDLDRVLPPDMGCAGKMGVLVRADRRTVEQAQRWIVDAIVQPVRSDQHISHRVTGG